MSHVTLINTLISSVDEKNNVDKATQDDIDRYFG